MNGLALALISVGLQAGVLLPQDASLRRSVAPAVGVSAAAYLHEHFELRVAYGFAHRRDALVGNPLTDERLVVASTYQRASAEAWGWVTAGPVRVGAGLGPALLLTGVDLSDQSDRYQGLTAEPGVVYGLALRIPRGDRLSVRFDLSGQRRGQRDDVLIAGGVEWRF